MQSATASVRRAVKRIPYLVAVVRAIRQSRQGHVTARVGIYDLLIPEDMAWAFQSTWAYYERNVIHWVARIAARLDAPIVYDIGANCGFYSLLLAQQASKVFAFEPVHETFNMLTKNVRINGVTNVVPLQFGVSDRSGSSIIKIYSSSANNSMSVELPANAPATLIRNDLVQIRAIDDLVGEGAVDPPDLMKIDIEGSELAAIMGARRTIHDSRPVIVVEHNMASGFDPAAQRDVINALLVEDYVIYGLAEDSDPTLYPLNRFDEISVGNLVAAPAERHALLRT